MNIQSLTLARQAMQVIIQNVSQQTLQRTTYCAMVVQLPNRNNVRAVVVAEAGRTAGGPSGHLWDRLDTALQVPIIRCAAPIDGEGTWHMNDAEQQALRTVMTPGDTTFSDAAIKAVVANRRICDGCRHTLDQLGLMLGPATFLVTTPVLVLAASEAIAP